MATDQRPTPPTPAGACDAHLHIFDPTQPASAPVMAHATVDDYRSVQARLGTTRAVIVQPRAYGTDHTVTLAAIASLGIEHARGVGVLHPEVSDAELERLHAGGLRGLRFSLYTPEHAAVSFDMVEPVAHRVKDLGWHLQLHWTAEQIAEHAALLRRLPVTLVFDHLSRLPTQGFAAHPAHAVVSELLEQGRAWVKLSGPYLCSALDEAADYADVRSLARHWVQTAPERLVWGSDWPHTTEATHPPDDAGLLRLLDDWADTPALRRRILVDNPAALYGFAPVPPWP